MSDQSSPTVAAAVEAGAITSDEVATAPIEDVTGVDEAGDAAAADEAADS